MNMYQYSRSAVLESLMEILKPISQNVFLTTRPSTTATQIQDYVVIRLPNGIRERGDTYQTAKVHIYLFARDRHGAVENAFRLEEMQSALTSLFPVIAPRYSADRPVYLSGGGDSGFHYLLFQITLTINKRDLSPIDVDQEQS